MLDLGSAQKPSFFPAECIKIEAGQSVKAKLTGNETSSMLLHACQTPATNAKSIEEVGRKVLGLDEATLQKFGVSVSKGLLSVNARVLDTPSIKYGGGGAALKPRDGSWNMRDVKVHKGSTIRKWTWIELTNGRPESRLDEAMGQFRRFSGNMGVNLGEPAQLPPGGSRSIDMRNATREKLNRIFTWASGQKLEFLLFLFSPNEDRSGAYNLIKILGDCIHGIHTSCMVVSKFMKKDMAGAAPYFANCALKWNLKAGGINHKLSQGIPILDPKEKTMVLGYDVTHPTNLPASKTGALPPSIVGVVSSVDPELGQWPSTVWEQNAKQEMLDDRLVDAFKRHLQLWAGKNKTTPSNIIIFRDGVSEGQFSQVLEVELPKIRKACAEICGKATPKMTIVVSVKRHQTRFYPSQEGEKTRSGNVQCGTVVDRDVTQARFWDFFLTAHNALQGTARPAHYTVLLDEIFRQKHKGDAANQLEKLTHEMCYLFGRATKAISICPPAYYADIVCERARVHRPEDFDDSVTESDVISEGGQPAQAQAQNLRIHDSLKDTMYYI